MVDVAAIYFPAWHDEPRHQPRHPAGWTEWELVRDARPRFPGHHQPLEPVWGYADESEPEVMRRSVETAAAYGIDAFLWDWYWYDGADFLNRPLDETYLRLDRHPTKFALMWANHEWREAFPARVGRPLEPVWPGAIDAAEFHRMTQVVIERYLGHPAYWRVDGAAWFTIFELHTLMDGLGGEVACAAALADFRERAREAGVGELHLNAMSGRWTGHDSTRLDVLGIDSVGPYTWTWSMPNGSELSIPYASWAESARARRALDAAELPAAYVPNVSMGWDSTARVDQRDELEVSGWPMLPVVVGNTPERFGEAVREALDFLAEQGESGRAGPQVLTLNAWNEWTEGSYLEPERATGMAYLEELARALGREDRRGPGGGAGGA